MASEEKQEQEEEKEEHEGIRVMENTSSESEESEESESEYEENQDKHQGLLARQYGNFRDYYQRRNEGLPEKHRRLEIFRKEWFEGKECLDIGCNNGILTINIAHMFLCRSMLGIDIDPDLVKEANSNLRKAVMLKPPGSTSGESSKHKDKDHAEDSEQSAAGSSNEEIPVELSSLEERNLLGIVSFKQENFIESQYPPELYDTILCLSVTQWIHLNWGDKGLITLFAKIWELLRPGGILVLEPQSWRSYENRHQLSIVTTTNFQKIELRPQHFQEILLDKIGFRTVEHINPSWLRIKARFNRPVLVFKK